MSPAPIWPLAAYFIAVILLVAVMIGLSHVLGQRHTGRATAEPYESGVVSTGSAQLRLSARFYLVAILFVIFDLEVVFLIAWAIAFRDLGWTGFYGALTFVGILVVGLVYEWRVGALDWGPSARRQVRVE